MPNASPTQSGAKVIELGRRFSLKPVLEGTFSGQSITSSVESELAFVQACADVTTVLLKAP